MKNRTNLMKLSALLMITTALGCAPQNSNSDQVEVQWTDYGVPHIKANNYRSLGFGYGYAVAKDRLCSLADHTITIRGERSRAYGSDKPAIVGFLPTTNLNSDLYYRVQLSDSEVELAANKLQVKTRDLTRGYAAGMNEYIAQMPSADRESACDGKSIPTFSEMDIVRAAMSVGTTWKAFHAAPFAASSAWKTTEAHNTIEAHPTQQLTHAEFTKLMEGYGSNTWAYGGDVVKNGGSIVVANPHSRWQNSWLLMHQVHLTIPGEIDVAGAAFLGLPFPQVGFNADISWSVEAPITVTFYVLQAMDVDASKINPTYTMDGVKKPLEIKNISLENLEADGSLSTKTFEIAYTELGPIYNLPAMPGRLGAKGHPAGWFAITDAGEGNAKGMDQLMDAARSTNIAEFRKAMEDNRGFGSHVIAGDRHGDTLYIESGPMLDISDSQMEACHYGGDQVAFNVLDGSKLECAVRGKDGLPVLASSDKFPTTVTRNIVHNTNGSYQYSIFGETTSRHSRFLGNYERPFNDPRLNMSERRMAELMADNIVTPEEALAVIFDNRNFFAEAWLDDLLSVCAGSDSANVKQACDILSSWDRKNNKDSRGVLMLLQVWMNIGLNMPIYANPDSDSPRALFGEHINITPETTPIIIAAMEKSVNNLKAAGLKGDEPWGSFLKAETPDGPIPLHGGFGGQGVLNVLEGGAFTPKGFAGISTGSAYIHVVRWEDKKMVADVILAHGQSDDLTAPDRIKQLKLFSDKKLYRYPFTQDALANANIVETITLKPQIE